RRRNPTATPATAKPWLHRCRGERSFGIKPRCAFDASPAACSSQSLLLGRHWLAAALVAKLAARHDAVNDCFKTAGVGSELAGCFRNQKVVGERQAAPQRIGHQFADKAAHEIAFAVLANVLPESLQSLSFAASREGGPGIHRAPAQIVRSLSA